jgi:hypothetical protein
VKPYQYWLCRFIIFRGFGICAAEVATVFFQLGCGDTEAKTVQSHINTDFVGFAQIDFHKSKKLELGQVPTLGGSWPARRPLRRCTTTPLYYKKRK